MIKNIFYIILLALIITTFMITIISYIIFRIRQQFGKNVSNLKHVLEGTYFRRYAPHLDEENRIAEQSTSDKPKFRKIKFATVAILIFTVTALFLVFENHINYRKELLGRKNDAERYRSLIEKGLLKKHSFNPINISISPTPYQQQQLKNATKRLRTTAIYLYTPKRPGKNHIEGWKQFCNRTGIKCISTSRIRRYRNMVIPGIERLNARARKQIINFKGNLIISGKLGTLNGLGKKSQQKDLLTQLAGTNLAQNKYDKEHTYQSGKFTWLSNQPYKKSDSKTIMLLDKSINKHRLSIAESDQKITTITLITDDLSPLNKVIEIIKSYNFPLTIINPNNTLPKEYEHSPLQHLSISGDLLNIRSQSAQKQFNQIEKWRFDFEEVSAEHIKGMWFLETLPQEHTLIAAINNKLEYIYLTDPQEYFQSNLLINGQLQIHTGASLIDTDILENKSLVNINAMKRVIKKRYEKAGSHFAVFLNQKHYDSPLCQHFLKTLLEFIDNNTSVVPFSSVAAQEKIISQMELKYHIKKKNIFVTLINGSDQKLDKINLRLESEIYKNQNFVVESIMPGINEFKQPLNH